MAGDSGFLGDEEEFGGEAGICFGGGHRLGGLAAGTEIEETVGGGFDDEDGGECGGLGGSRVYNRIFPVAGTGLGVGPA